MWFYSLMFFTINVIFLYDYRLTTTNILSAQWVLMAWCFSTRASAATVLSTHPCVSSCSGVNAHDLCFVMVWVLVSFTHILQGYFTGSETNSMSVPVPMKQPYRIWIITFHNYDITQTKCMITACTFCWIHRMFTSNGRVGTKSW